jgi:hypothetical protein
MVGERHMRAASGTTSAPGMRVLSRLNGCMRSPVNASPMPSRVSAHDEVDAVRYSFIVMDLHHVLLAGLPAHSGLPPETDIVRAIGMSQKCY